LQRSQVTFVLPSQCKTKGNELVGEGEYAQAIPHYLAAGKEAPKPSKGQEDRASAAVLSNLSLCYLKGGRFDKATSAAEGCVAAAPSWVKGYFRHGEVLRHAGDYQGASRLYRKALAIDPHNDDVHEYLGTTEALAALQAAPEEVLSPPEATALRALQLPPTSTVVWTARAALLGLLAVLAILAAEAWARPGQATVSMAGGIVLVPSVALAGGVVGAAVGYAVGVWRQEERRARLAPPELPTMQGATMQGAGEQNGGEARRLVRRFAGRSGGSWRARQRAAPPRPKTV